MLRMFYKSKHISEYKRYLDFVDQSRNLNLENRHSILFPFNAQDEIDFCTSNGITDAVLLLSKLFHNFPSITAITKACYSNHFDVIDELVKIRPYCIMQLDRNCIKHCYQFEGTDLLELFFEYGIKPTYGDIRYAFKELTKNLKIFIIREIS